MMKVVGIRPSSFKGSDGDTVEGKNFFFTYELEKGEGEGTDRAFLTLKRLSDLPYVPAVGDEVELEYNRYGKVSGFRVVD